MKRFLIAVALMTSFSWVVIPSVSAQSRSELVYYFIHCHENKYATNDPRDTTSYTLHQYSNIFSYDMPITSNGRYAVDAAWIFPDKAKKELNVEGKCFLEESLEQETIENSRAEMVQNSVERGNKKSPPDRVKDFKFKP